MKPVIGITTSLVEKNNQSTISMNYVDSILMAGGIPVNLPVVNDDNCIDGYLNILDGILFSGGEDVAPYYFGENPIKGLRSISSRRDEFELSICKNAYKRNIPILGICKGVQLINVALGGTLYQDIDSQIKDSLGHSPSGIGVDELYHSINIKKNSRLYEIFPETNMLVNSFHHQSIKDLGMNLVTTALSEDGIIEAVEGTENRFLMGIQWHPECLTRRYPKFLRLFEAFVGAADECRQNKSRFQL